MAEENGRGEWQRRMAEEEGASTSQVEQFRRLYDHTQKRYYYLYCKAGAVSWESPSRRKRLADGTVKVYREVKHPKMQRVSQRCSNCSDIDENDGINVIRAVSEQKEDGNGVGIFIVKEDFTLMLRGESSISGLAINSDSDLEQAHEQCRKVAKELRRYPKSFFILRDGVKRILSRVVICRSLYLLSNDEIGSVAKLKRHHVYDHATGTMYIDSAERQAFWEKRTFHHELWHGVDYGMRGSSYTNDHARDPDFCKFNPRGFKYGDGGHKMRDEKPQSADELSSPSPSHFLNLYSTASIAEDRAEVWSTIMTQADKLSDKKSLLGKAKILMARATELGCWTHLKSTFPWTEHYNMNTS